MSTTPAQRPGLSRTVSSMRLAVATRAMERAETREQVIAAKDKAKALGLLPADMDALRTAFDRAYRALPR